MATGERARNANKCARQILSVFKPQCTNLMVASVLIHRAWLVDAGRMLRTSWQYARRSAGLFHARGVLACRGFVLPQKASHLPPVGELAVIDLTRKQG